MNMYLVIAGNGRQYGPFSNDEVKSWITKDWLYTDSKIKKEGDTAWTTISTIQEFSSIAHAAPPPSAQPPKKVEPKKEAPKPPEIKNPEPEQKLPPPLPKEIEKPAPPLRSNIPLEPSIQFSAQSLSPSSLPPAIKSSSEQEYKRQMPTYTQHSYSSPPPQTPPPLTPQNPTTPPPILADLKKESPKPAPPIKYDIP